MQRTGSCPDLNDLAAFADGRLQGAKRDQVVAHLNRCEACYAIFSDTMHFLQQEEGVEAEPVPEPAGKHWWPVALAAAVLLAAILAPPIMQLSQASPWTRADEWAAAYGQLPPDSPFAARAAAVFEKVARTFALAEDKTPRPLLIEKSSSPLAMALPDGTIVISSGGLDLCYRDVPPEAGDARLAYVLGHELDHLRHGEDFHAFAAYALKDAQPGAQPELASAEHNSEKELRADRWGLVHAVMAGYDPRLILRQSEEFFQQWVSQPTYAGHPEPPERARLLLESLDEVEASLHEFQMGVRFYQLGSYEESVRLFERFLARFPSREVHSNLGLAHFQLAARELSQCDGVLVSRFFRLPLQLDTQTLADAKRLRGFDPSLACLENPRYKDELSAARQAFQQARKLDPSYLPALLNLVSTELLDRQYETAFLIVSDAPQAALQDSRVKQALALCDFALGQERGQSDQVDDSIRQMRRLHEQQPQSAEIAYNLAFMLDQVQPEQADPLWEAFLQLEPYGPFASRARVMLGLPETDENPAEPEPPPAPLPLGPPSAESQRRLEQMKPSPLDAGDGASMTVYEDDRLRVLARNGRLEIVEEKPVSPLSAQDVLELYGQPPRRLANLQGEFWDYPGFAFDLSGQSVRSLVHYSLSQDGITR